MTQEGDGVNLETSLAYLLKQAHSALRSSMDAVLRPLDMTVPQYACLELLAQRPGLSNSELARGTFVSRQSMNVLLQSLERDGFVSRQQHPSSGRILPTRLTTLGAGRLRAASAAVETVELQMHTGISPAEQDQLRALLISCVTALSARQS